jgi:hypothetical protein
MFVTTRLFSIFSPARRTFFTVLLSLSFFTIMGIIFTAPDFYVAKVILRKLVSVSSLAEGIVGLTLQGWVNIIFIVSMIICLRIEISTQVLLSGSSAHRDRHILGYRPPLWQVNYGWLIFFCLLFMASFYFVGLSAPFVYFQF